MPRESFSPSHGISKAVRATHNIYFWCVSFRIVLELSTTEVVSFPRQMQRMKGMFCVRAESVFKVSCFHKVVVAMSLSCVCVCVCVCVLLWLARMRKSSGGMGGVLLRSKAALCSVLWAETHALFEGGLTARKRSV